MFFQTAKPFPGPRGTNMMDFSGCNGFNGEWERGKGWLAQESRNLKEREKNMKVKKNDERWGRNVEKPSGYSVKKYFFEEKYGFSYRIQFRRL